MMKMLLTSAGVKNAHIHEALLDLLGKPIAESSALCIPTGSYAHPMAGFVSEIAKINKGRAFFATPDALGEYLLVDYVTNKKKVQRA